MGRVVHIAWLSDVGGGELFVLDLLRSIDRAHLSHELYCIGPGGTLDEAANGLGLPVRRFPKESKLAPTTIWRMAAALRHARPDIVQTHGEAGVFWGIPAALLARAPVLCSLIYQSHRGAADKMWAMRRLLPRADVVIAGSEAVRQFATAQLGVSHERTEVILCGIDTGMFREETTVPVRDFDPAGRDRRRARPVVQDLEKPPAAATGPVLLTVGRLVEPKGHTVLLEAMARLRATHSRAELWIVGDGPRRAALMRRAEALGIAKCVRFLGTVYPTLALLRRADVFVFPSLIEPQGLAVLEALAAGVPVVASRTGGIIEMVRDGVDGRLVPPGDPEALATAIVEVLADPVAAAARAAAGRERARQWDIRVVARRYEALYQRLVPASTSATPDR